MGDETFANITTFHVCTVVSGTSEAQRHINAQLRTSLLLFAKWMNRGVHAGIVYHLMIQHKPLIPIIAALIYAGGGIVLMVVSLNRVAGLENLRARVDDEFFHMFLVRCVEILCL